MISSKETFVGILIKLSNSFIFIKIHLKIKYQINIIKSYLSRNLAFNNFVFYIIDL